MDRLDIDSVTLPSAMGKDINIFSALKQAINQLDNDSASSLEAEILLSYVLKKPRSFLYSWPEQTLNAQQLLEFESLLSRRIEGEPIAYIVGQREFWSLPFHVNRHTLIPRPETELLVETALELGAYLSATKARLYVLDVATGSGCIALSLAKEKPDWQIYASDYSRQALDVAQYNAEQLDLDQVQFIQSDWFSALSATKQFDMIVSNPPYVAEDDPHLQQGDVRFEPRDALASGLDGLDAIRILARDSFAHLHHNGWLVFELGYDQAKAVANIVQKCGYNYIFFVKDLAGIRRHCVAHKP